MPGLSAALAHLCPVRPILLAVGPVDSRILILRIDRDATVMTVRPSPFGVCFRVMIACRHPLDPRSYSWLTDERNAFFYQELVNHLRRGMAGRHERTSLRCLDDIEYAACVIVCRKNYSAAAAYRREPLRRVAAGRCDPACSQRAGRPHRRRAG
jgi:hypothetical protein